jgi:glycosyltransferase involved in cell wall biosynthesis
MARQNPLVSIGLPVYNGAAFIEETIESLLKQSLEDFELIISDNASKDGTAEICRYYAAHDPRIRFISNDRNLGAATNYNQVFHLSRGKYFKWSACDDLHAPEFLTECVAILQSRPEVVLCYAKTQIIDAHHQPIEMKEDRLRLDANDVALRFSDCLSAMKLCHNPIFGVMRKEVLAKTRLKGAYLAADRCLVAELTLYGPFYEIPDRLFIRRKHADNIGTTREFLPFWDPRLTGKIVFPEWRVAREHILSVRLSPLGVKIKMRLFDVVLKWVYAKRKILLAQLIIAGRQFLEKLLSLDLKPGKAIYPAAKMIQRKQPHIGL